MHNEKKLDIILTPENQLYKENLIKKFCKATGYGEFSQLIEQEITRFGDLDWSYSLLDLPDRLTALNCLGSINKQYINYYIERELYQYDLLLQHVKVSDIQIFQSDIEKFLTVTPNVSELNNRYKNLLCIGKTFKYYDILSIPIINSVDGSRFQLSILSKDKNIDRFKNIASMILPKLKTLGIAICDAGVRQYNEKFVSPKKAFDSMARSQPLNLLATIVKYDLSVVEGARRLKITASTANKHLITIRKFFGVTTNYSAYDKAVKLGYIK